MIAAWILLGLSVAATIYGYERRVGFVGFVGLIAAISIGGLILTHYGF